MSEAPGRLRWTRWRSRSPPDNATAKKASAESEKLKAEYSGLIDDYNSLVDQYNAAIDTVTEAKNLKSDVKKLQSKRDDLQKQVDNEKAQLQSLTGQVDQAKKNSVSDGVWQVGTDIDAGTYRATSEVGHDCFWSVSVGDDILQLDMPTGGYPQVSVSDGQQLKLQNCGTFAKQ